MNGHDEDWLILDDIFESGDPAVKSSLEHFMREEMALAHERATIRLARKFSYLLPPRQRHILATQYPDATAVA